MKQLKQNKEVKIFESSEDIEQFYIDHKKTQKHVKSTKCPMANKNCKQWNITKQKCERGWCGI